MDTHLNVLHIITLLIVNVMLGLCQFQQQVPVQQQQQFQQQNQQFQQANLQQQQQQVPQFQQQQQVPQQQQQAVNQQHIQQVQQQNQVASGGQQVQQAVSHFKDHAKDTNHMKEHMQGILDKDPAEMTEEELQMFYFHEHDVDQNNKLDGLELIHAMTHFQPDAAAEGHGHGHGQDAQQPPDVRSIPLDEIEAMVDAILAADDRNKDGFIDYAEFANSALK